MNSSLIVLLLAGDIPVILLRYLYISTGCLIAGANDVCYNVMVLMDK